MEFDKLEAMARRHLRLISTRRDLVVGSALRQGFVYRGTFDYDIGPVTCVSLDLLTALYSGLNRCRSLYYQQIGARPMMLAIKPGNYSDIMRGGLEIDELEIFGRINFDDITAVSSVHKLFEVAPSVCPADIYTFRRFYLEDTRCSFDDVLVDVQIAV